MPKNVMCKNCNNYRNDWCEMVLDSPDPDIVRDCRHFWLKTNADRIRAMTDEELEKFINHFNICDMRTNDECKFSYCACCEVCVMDWLQQPAEGDA